MTIHERKKSFKCNTSFSKKRHLNGPIESVHKGKKPFKSNDCDSFFQKRVLNRHIESVHERKKPLQCNNNNNIKFLFFLSKHGILIRQNKL